MSKKPHILTPIGGEIVDIRFRPNHPFNGRYKLEAPGALFCRAHEVDTGKLLIQTERELGELFAQGRLFFVSSF